MDPQLNYKFFYDIMQRAHTSRKYQDSTKKNDFIYLHAQRDNLHRLQSGKALMNHLESVYGKIDAQSNYAKMYSKICKNATIEEKAIILGDTLPKGADVKTYFDEHVHRYFKAHSNDRMKETHIEDVDSQLMSDKNLINYIDMDDMKEKLLEKLKTLNRKNIVANQMIVAFAILIMSNKIRRLDVAMIKFRNIQENDNAILKDDCSGFTIKETTKTKVKNCHIEFSKIIEPYVCMLMKARRARKEDYLFMKVQSRQGVGKQPDTHWFGREFKKRLFQMFDKNVTVSMLRISMGIKLSEKDRGDVKYQRYIESFMGHTYAVHQRYYNLFKSLPGRLEQD
ncbi:hypothetical protein DFJ77DRAFT_439920 [Powellomyces hirtus]|nr:hypothetical protein DFJ77DRAFT_439920 [Powellomyces hirtus]